MPGDDPLFTANFSCRTIVLIFTVQFSKQSFNNLLTAEANPVRVRRAQSFRRSENERRSEDKHNVDAFMCPLQVHSEKAQIGRLYPLRVRLGVVNCEQAKEQIAKKSCGDNPVLHTEQFPTE
jgi:hypothetical protein